MVYRFGTKDIDYINKAVGKIHSIVSRDFREITNLQNSPNSVINFALLSYRKCLHSLISDLSKQYEADFIVPSKVLIAYDVSSHNQEYRDISDFLNLDKINIFGNSKVFDSQKKQECKNEIKFFISVIDDLTSFSRSLNSSGISIITEVKNEEGSYNYGLAFYYDYNTNDCYTSIDNQLFCNNIKQHGYSGYSKFNKYNFVKFYNNKMITGEQAKNSFFNIVNKFSANSTTYSLNKAIVELATCKIDAVVCYNFEDINEFIGGYYLAKSVNIEFHSISNSKNIINLEDILKDKKFIAKRSTLDKFSNITNI